MSADVLTLRQLNRATLARQMLLAREKTTALAAIERLVAMQAQWPRPPFVGLWSRVAGFERSDLTSLFIQKKAVRATSLRGTIHVSSAKDYLGFRPVVQPALEAGLRAILKDRLDGMDLDALTARARTILAKRPQTFAQLREEFLRAQPKADERAMGYSVRMLLPLVQVPEQSEAWAYSSQAAFALADQWLARKVTTTHAVPDPLILRYLAAYGPATAADFQAWSGVSREATRSAFERLRPTLRTFRDEGRKELFDLTDAPRPSADVSAPVRFVPEYDNLIAARADGRIVAREHRPRIFLSALRIAATVLVDGSAAATWKLDSTKKAATITIDPFGKLPAKVRKDIQSEAEDLARFAEPDARTHIVAFSS
jgi:winged helix DNA-binding protein